MRATVVCLTLAVAISGCGLIKRHRDVYAEAKPAADALRRKLVAAAKLVDEHDPPTEDDACDSPKKLTYDPMSDAHDTDYMMLQEAKRGGAKADDETPDEKLRFSFIGPLVDVMWGTSDKSPYSDYALSGFANQASKDRVRRGLQVKNVVLVRERSIYVDYFLVDLEKNKPKILCAGSFFPTADPDAAEASTKEYLKITKNKKTGKVIKTEKQTVTSDPKGASLYVNARNTLALRMENELGLAFPK
jgi:hypothetical protein